MFRLWLPASPYLLLPCSRTGPAQLHGLNRSAGSGEAAVRDPLYVFAVSNCVDSDNDRRSKKLLLIDLDSALSSDRKKFLMPID